MLLTSGQVSVAISSVVVFMFTGALFLSGYILQQQTVRDLRAAIQPKPTPQAARLYLPTQFVVQPNPSPKANAIENLDRGAIDIEVINDKVGVAGLKDSERLSEKEAPKPVEGAGLRTTIDQKPLERVEDLLPSGGNPSETISAKDTQQKEKPLSRVERRRKIKEEIMATGDGEGFKGYRRRQY